MVKVLRDFFSMLSHIVYHGDVMKKYGLLLIGALIYFLMIKYMFLVFCPFIFALICYYALKPLILRISRFFHMTHSYLGTCLIVLILFILSFFIGLCFYQLCICMKSFIYDLPYYYQHDLIPFFQNLSLSMQSLLPYIFGSDILITIENQIYQIFFSLITPLSQIVTQIPYYLFTFFLFVLSTIFIFIDYDQIRYQLSLYLPESFFHQLTHIKIQCLDSLAIYIKCQIILTFISFIILIITFSLLKMSHPILLSIITSLLDILPLIGIGIIILPLCCYYLLQHQWMKGIYLILIYLFIHCVRNILEPFIYHKEISIPSFLLLLSMVIHMYFFGFIGVVLSPIHMNLLYSLLDYCKTKD